MVGIMAVITTLRYDDAIVLPRRDKESANVLFLSLVSNFIINLLLFLVILIWGKKILTWLNIPSGFPISILYLVPLSVFLYNTYQSVNYWLIRERKYYSVSFNKLIRRGFEGISQISFALLKNPKGLIFSDIIGQSANVITIIFQGFKYGFSFKFISVGKIKYVLKKYSDFPKYNLVPSLISTCSTFLPLIYINKFFSAENTGYFDLSKLLLSLPLALVANSVSNVLLQRIAEKYHRRDSFVNELKPVLFVIIAICIAEVLVILLFGIDIFKFAFGANWGVSGEISKIMVWSFAINFLVSSFSCVFISMQKIRTYSGWQLFYFLAIFSLLFFKNLTFIEFIKIYVLIEVVCFSVLAGLILYIIARYELSLKTR